MWDDSILLFNTSTEISSENWMERRGVSCELYYVSRIDPQEGEDTELLNNAQRAASSIIFVKSGVTTLSRETLKYNFFVLSRGIVVCLMCVGKSQCEMNASECKAKKQVSVVKKWQQQKQLLKLLLIT